MITLTSAQATKVMIKLGGVKREGKHDVFRLRVKDKLVANVPVPRHKGDLPTGTAKSIFTALNLKDDSVRKEMRDCTMKLDDYVRHLEAIDAL